MKLLDLIFRFTATLPPPSSAFLSLVLSLSLSLSPANSFSVAIFLLLMRNSIRRLEKRHLATVALRKAE